MARQVTPGLHPHSSASRYRCKYCGLNGNAKTLLLLHLKPRMLGGTNDIENLVTACQMCSYWKRERDYSNYLSESVSQNTQYHQTFLVSLQNIERLIKLNVDDPLLGETLHRLLFANTVAAMEAYLSDAFINTVVNDPMLMRKFMETTPAFNEKKYKLSEIYEWLDKTKESVTQYLLEIVYHNIFIVKNMYKCVLDIDFSDDVESVQKAVIKRHDIVHRNGKTKSGEILAITDGDVSDNIERIKAFVNYIDEQLKLKIRGNRFL